MIYIVVVIFLCMCSVYFTYIQLTSLETGTMVRKNNDEPYVIWKHEGFMLLTHIILYILSVVLPIILPIVVWCVNLSKHGAYGKTWRYNHALFREI